jgi:sugar lactone lactonase YvrE
VAVDQVDVYWTEFTGSVYRATKLQKVVAACATGQDAPLGIAVDAVHIYWSNYGGGSIMRSVKAASPDDAGATQPTVLASDLNGPTTIALGQGSRA